MKNATTNPQTKRLQTMSQNTDDDENDVEEESEQLRLWQNELEFLNL